MSGAAHKTGIIEPPVFDTSNGPVTFERIDREILATLEPPTYQWFLCFLTAVCCLIVGICCWANQILNGIGLSGKNNPFGWAVFITDFVFWVGIAHAGTLISAILFLFRAKWRVPIYRLSEAMTVFAVATAGLFPLIHLGRVWYFYFLLPYPNQRYLWPNFKSPLLWDVFAVSTYLTISVCFFITGLIPDIAAARDRATGFRKILYTVTALGWRGSANQWRHYMAAYGFFAALATPLVLSVHSVVSWDFAMSIVPGWHTTIFPPYFVAGAIFSGLAMVITIGVPLRTAFKLEAYLTVWQFEKMAQLIMFTGNIVTLAYATEFFIAWYSQNPFEQYQFWFRAFGSQRFYFWMMVFCNCIIPQTLWIKKLRTSLTWLWILSIFINIGMWFERFNIIAQSLSRDYIPYTWDNYVFTWNELGITLGSFGWFFTLFLVFIKYFPSMSIVEVKETLPAPMREGH